MPHPKKRTSSTKQGMRRSHHALKQKELQNCAKCGEAVLPHHACKNCGTYKGKQVLSV